MKKISIILFSIILFGSISFGSTASAYSDVIAVGQRILSFITGLPSDIAQIAEKVYIISKGLLVAITAQSLLLNKIAALMAVQLATKLIVGDGIDGTIIRDFNDYLYVSPQQKAMAQMNLFFNTVSRGRLSTLNYEGVGPNYDAYLVSQARMAISGQPFSTNLQDLVTDPTQMFVGGNMKGLMTYVHNCANNVACYTLTSAARYNSEFEKAQNIAKNENVNGFNPKKVNGRITQPASLAQSALTQLDQLGTQVIMDAKLTTDEKVNLTGIEQVWTGAAISATARLTNYGISDDAGKASIINQNNQFPFSLGYSTKGGFGINAGGITASTGVGAISGAVQIGTTCAAGGFVVDARGAAVVIDGKQRPCVPADKSSSVTKPSVSGTLPSITNQ